MFLLQTVSSAKASRSFHWDWREAQFLSYATPSLKDTKMSDADRAALAKAIEAYIGPPDSQDPEIASEDQVE
jgi:hypothetical protein